MRWNKYFSKRINGFAIQIMLLLISNFATIGHATAQDASASEIARQIDGLVKKRSIELLLAFGSLYSGMTHGAVVGLSEIDRVIVDITMYSAPYKIDAIEVLESACDYYYSTEYEDLDVEILARFLADSDRVYYEHRIDFLEQAYQSLSTNGKAQFNDVVFKSIYPAASKYERNDSSESYYRMGEHIRFRRDWESCESLPEARSRLESREYVFDEIAISIERNDND